MKLGFESQEFWCGSEASYEFVLKSCARASEAKSLAADGLPPMWSKVGNTAVVDIFGPLIQGDAGFMRILGITGYDNIRQAVVDAVNDPEVDSILLNVDSGGGEVSGVTDTAKFLAEAGTMKPISTYSGGMMASAALWTGATSQHITVADTAVVGSIGVLIVHQEKSKMLSGVGVTSTVIRAGKYKANTNSLEPLSMEGAAALQSQVDHLYKPFNEHMAEMRGTTPEIAHATFADGRVFVGTQALDVGLVDKIGTYEEALAKAVELGATAKNAKTVRRDVAKASFVADNPQQSNKGSFMTKPTLPATATAEEISAAGELQAAAQKSESEIAKFLRAELKDVEDDLRAAEASVLALTVERDTQASSAQAATTVAASFEAIVQASLNTMSIGLGNPGATTLTGAELVAEHEKVKAVYETKFKGGGVAATTPVEPTDGKPAAFDPIFAARAQSFPLIK